MICTYLPYSTPRSRIGYKLDSCFDMRDGECISLGNPISYDSRIFSRRGNELWAYLSSENRWALRNERFFLEKEPYGIVACTVVRNPKPQ